jgi:vitamin B12 transporter
MYRFEGAFGAHFGRENGTEHPWFVEANALLRGPMFYDTEELLLIPLAEPASTYVHRKAPFWTFNLKGQVQLTKALTLTGLVNNVFDINQHPVFIALDKEPRLADPRFQNGSPLGTSMPGRSYELRLQARF